ncbi:MULTISPECIES: hypothetical protein [unclassified Nocardioides]|uniref:hypothetical protein n=1 Tax=unclassified Nocardioides TaxID=2615069 RepID=UPI0030144230
MLRRLLLLVAVLSAPTLLPLPALGATWSDRDASRDVVVTTYASEPEPCGTWTDRVDPADRTQDITRVSVRHSRSRVRVTVRFRDVAPRDARSTTVYLRTQRRDVEIEVSRFAGSSATRVALMTLPDYDAIDVEPTEDNPCGTFVIAGPDASCRGLRGRIDHARDRVVVVLSRRCLRDPRWVRAGVSSYAFGGDENEVLRSDRWEPRGATPSTRIDGPYGPRVRVG